MADLERSIEMGCGTLVKAMLDLEEIEGEHSEVEFTFEFAKVDYKITVARIGRKGGSSGSKDS